MSTGHTTVEGLYQRRTTPLHALDPAAKLVCLLAFVLAVVATPPQAVWAFGCYGLLVASAAVVARIPATTMVRRMLIELPFVFFAVALPFIGSGPRTVVGGLSLSVPGSWAAWAIIVKGALGVGACVILAWSTPVPALLAGCDRLHVPRVLTAIAGFMVRYLDVVASELRRLQIARISRADDQRSLAQVRAVTGTVGTLFVRSFERGERVHHAMLSRGFTGRFPSADREPKTQRWWPSAVWPCAAGSIALIALVNAP
jgi:cobalt/nickel transport system permease protein